MKTLECAVQDGETTSSNLLKLRKSTNQFTEKLNMVASKIQETEISLTGLKLDMEVHLSALSWLWIRVTNMLVCSTVVCALVVTQLESTAKDQTKNAT